MESNGSKILGYAAVVLAVLILISFFAGFLAWVWAKLVLGFAIATVIWLLKKANNKPTGDGFIVLWGLVIATVLAVLDLTIRFLALYGLIIVVVIFICLGIWGLEKLKRRP